MTLSKPSADERGSLVWKQRVRNAAIGYVTFPDGEVPPPSALAGRRVVGPDLVEIERPRGRIGKGIFGVFYSKYDHGAPSEAESTVRRRKTVMYNTPPVPEKPNTLLAQGQGSTAEEDTLMRYRYSID